MHTTDTLKLISWNVQARTKDGRVKDAPKKQVEALDQQKPDLVALQDISIASVAQYECAFKDIGLDYVLHTFQGTLDKEQKAGPKEQVEALDQQKPDKEPPTGVLIASRFKLERLPCLPPSAFWPERYRSPDPEKMLKHWARRTLFVTFQSSWERR